jgi:hypothetical protein
MPAQTGRTHSKWLGVFLNNAAGALTDLSSYVNTVSQFGLTYDTQDTTAFADAIKNIVLGQPGAPITLGGPIDTVIITHFAIAGINGSNTPLSLDLRIGIRQSWVAGEPQFGLTKSSTSGYVCTAFTVDPGANTWSASLDVFGPTAPAFGTGAETSGS